MRSLIRVLALVALASCGRVGFETDDSCSWALLDESFAPEITAWNAAGGRDNIDAIVAYDASCAPDLDWVDARLADPDGTPRTVTDLDWSAALSSYFLSASASSYGPTLAVRIDGFLAAAGTATARARMCRTSAGDDTYQLLVFAEVSGRVVMCDGHHSQDSD